MDMHPQAKKLLADQGRHSRFAPDNGEDRRHHGLSCTEMSQVPDQKSKKIADSVLVRLSTFALGVALYGGIARSIVEKVAADPVPHLGRLGNAGLHRGVTLPVRWQPDRGEAEVLVFLRGWRPRLSLAGA